MAGSSDLTSLTSGSLGTRSKETVAVVRKKELRNQRVRQKVTVAIRLIFPTRRSSLPSTIALALSSTLRTFLLAFKALLSLFFKNLSLLGRESRISKSHFDLFFGVKTEQNERVLDWRSAPLEMFIKVADDG